MCVCVAPNQLEKLIPLEMMKNLVVPYKGFDNGNKHEFGLKLKANWAKLAVCHLEMCRSVLYKPSDN